MVYVKHFDILGIDTAQIPCIELQGAPTSATEGAVGLLGMDVTSEGREIYVCTAVNGSVYTWQSLRDGKDGTCVRKAEINDRGNLILTLSDGSTIDTGVARGEKGDKGDRGDKGDKGDKGDTGDTGPRGEQGDPGVSIVKAELTPHSELKLSFSNDTIVNLGSIKGDTGDPGPQGDPGEQGESLVPELIFHEESYLSHDMNIIAEPFEVGLLVWIDDNNNRRSAVIPGNIWERYIHHYEQIVLSDEPSGGSYYVSELYHSYFMLEPHEYGLNLRFYKSYEPDSHIHIDYSNVYDVRLYKLA